MTDCPLPYRPDGRITLAHGGGGHAARRLLDELILPAFSNDWLDQGHDAVRLPALDAGIVFASDGHVVSPLEFPGGDIGRLAIIGTANDLAMAGAEPRWFSVDLVLEEGLPLACLARIVASMAESARDLGAAIVCGDTKVVERRRADGLYIGCSGIGEPRTRTAILPRSVRAGDRLIVSGDIGRHGMAILAAREEIALSGLKSDLSPLWPAVRGLLDAGIEPHCLRDLTRGGLAAAVSEIAATAGLGMRIDEAAIPIDPAIASAADILGIEPLQLACEGRMLVVVAPSEADACLAHLRRRDPMAAAIGRVTSGSGVTLVSAYGTTRPLILPEGELLPRIC